MNATAIRPAMISEPEKPFRHWGTFEVSSRSRTPAKDNTPHCAMPAYDESKSPLENARIRREAGF